MGAINVDLIAKRIILLVVLMFVIIFISRTSDVEFLRSVGLKTSRLYYETHPEYCENNNECETVCNGDYGCMNSIAAGKMLRAGGVYPRGYSCSCEKNKCVGIPDPNVTYPLDLYYLSVVANFSALGDDSSNASITNLIFINLSNYTERKTHVSLRPQYGNIKNNVAAFVINYPANEDLDKVMKLIEVADTLRANPYIVSVKYNYYGSCFRSIDTEELVFGSNASLW